MHRVPDFSLFSYCSRESRQAVLRSLPEIIRIRNKGTATNPVEHCDPIGNKVAALTRIRQVELHGPQ